MKELQFALFGKLQVASEAGKTIEIDARKAQELLCFLLLFRNQPHSRDVIADTLWVENPSDQSRSYLRRTLWQLQHVLEEQAGRLEQPLLLVEQDWLQLNPCAALWIDVSVFESTYSTVRGIPGEDLDEQAAKLLDSAAELYQGHLLEGWYQDWCIYERERLLHIYLVMLDKLMRYCSVQNRFEEGIEYGMRVLRHDRAREYTHRQLMRLHYQARDRSAAIQQYDRCAKALQEELGVEPTRRTRRLYDEIIRDSRNIIPSLPPSPSSAITTERLALQELLRDLQLARADAKRLDGRIDQQIEAIQKLLSQ